MTATLEAEPPEPEPAGPAGAAHRPGTRRGGTASAILMGAMLGLADALGWERPREDTVEMADAPLDDDGLDLSYGLLDPLDWT